MPLEAADADDGPGPASAPPFVCSLLMLVVGWMDWWLGDVELGPLTRVGSGSSGGRQWEAVRWTWQLAGVQLFELDILRLPTTHSQPMPLFRAASGVVIRCFRSVEKVADAITGAAGPVFIFLAWVLTGLGGLVFCESVYGLRAA